VDVADGVAPDQIVTVREGQGVVSATPVRR